VTRKGKTERGDDRLSLRRQEKQKGKADTGNFYKQLNRASEREDKIAKIVHGYAFFRNTVGRERSVKSNLMK